MAISNAIVLMFGIFCLTILLNNLIKDICYTIREKNYRKYNTPVNMANKNNDLIKELEEID